MKKRLRLILVGLFFALMFSYAGASAYISFTRGSLRASEVRGWSFVSTEDGRVVVSDVARTGPATQLRAGDEVLTLDGQPIASFVQIYRFFEHLKPGTPYTISILRDGQPLSLSLTTVPAPPGWWAQWWILKLITPLIFLSTGLALFLLKPFDRQALNVAIIFGMTIPNSIPFYLMDQPLWLVVLVIAGYALSAGLIPARILQTFMNFPERHPLLDRYPRLAWYIYLPPLLFSVPYLVLAATLGATRPERLYVYPLPLLSNIFTVLFLLYVGLAHLILLLNYRNSTEVARRKIRVIVVASIAGASVFMVYIFLRLIDRTVFPLWNSEEQWNWFYAAGIAALWIIPLAWTYAIRRHQVIPVSLLVRRSVQYLLATGVLRVILALPIIAIVLTVILNPHRTLSEIIFRNSIYLYLLLLAAATVSLTFRKRLIAWVDRKFFREHYNQEQILRELIDDVRKSDSIKEMSKLVSLRVDSALHPEHIYLFYQERENRELSLGYSSGGGNEEMRIPQEFQLLRYMEYQGSAIEFPFPHKNNLPQSEKAWLAELGTRLIVPMNGTDNRLTGLFLLGQKRSEVPYTASDRQLLETLADQIAIVYENVRLKERVHRDHKITREVLSRFEDQKINLLKECPACGTCFDSTAQFCTTDRSELTLSLPVERNVEARYRLDQLIGRGGMGAVYEAFDMRLSRQVAVKILMGSMFGNLEALRRFEREAQTAARLSHPNIITVYDYGVLKTEGAYLVMELARGETLGATIRRERYIHPQIAAECFDQMLEAIKAAHQAGIVHRDLKPENVIILQGEKNQKLIKVLDFGLAKIVSPDISNPDSPASLLTSPGTVMGTLGYMSPEQLTGGQVDERSDLFSIGVMIVEALTGQRPFNGKTYHELLTNLLHQTFHLEDQSPAAQRLDAILQKCLAKERAERIASAADLQHELIPALRQCPALAPRPLANLDADTLIL
jgi:hypothetical protein